MFGESESESPRVPSPWDSLSPSPSPSPPPPSHQILPRLPPESDLGNVEYKLQLLSPSTSRFTRLVTQLKWRLLEGGGQAYYELGVSDSGLLVGLSRDDLETSLETLEMMAGEIGASVIVVKEVEVPGRMAEIARRQEDYRKRASRNSSEGDFHFGSADSATSITTTSTSTTETETDETETETGTEQEESASASPSLKPANASDTTDLFVMDPDTDSELSIANAGTFVSLEISSVFKPRPFRTRVQLSPLNPHSHTRRRDAKKEKWKEKEAKQMKWREKNRDKESNTHSSTENEEDSSWKSTNRRMARDRRREEKRKALVAAANKSLAAREVENDAHNSVTTVSSTITSTVTSTSSPGPVDSVAVPTISLTTPTSAETPVTATLSTSTTVTTATTTSLLPEESPFLLTLSDLSLSDGQEAEPEPDDDADDTDIFPTPSIPHKHFVMSMSMTSQSTSTTPLSASEGFLTGTEESASYNDPHGSVNVHRAGINGTGTLQVPVPVPGVKDVNGEGDDDVDPNADARYIVEALVVRKMSLEEAFLDFGGFSVMADM
ncbi:hypothetical protein D9758_005775 [Tetrapyrgos nigripes]|uniref:Uncharacterized protein n=1 Tax=Tetrapyrgos nigripes TaxID=182062 RepID=A0A8H5GK18_9AGAR|nr:hypothetical protein D9758_005775 [Tetrapyrgos nigripes]